MQLFLSVQILQSLKMVLLHPRQLQHPLLRQLRLLLHHQSLLRQLQAEQLLRCLLSVRA
jgi:hypothetical protein